ncbi:MULTISPECIES: hypothetical protein [Kribbella]|uniref:hypothetical protein n=1 Tax=Kribbella TaxID=182639 RepID=UPI0018EE7C46|nr:MULTISPECIES: hypothetical protein [Kribbella]
MGALRGSPPCPSSATAPLASADAGSCRPRDHVAGGLPGGHRCRRRHAGRRRAGTRGDQPARHPPQPRSRRRRSFTLQRAVLQASAKAQAYGKQEQKPAKERGYPDGDFGNSLATLAQLIKAKAGVRVATIDVGGWDVVMGRLGLSAAQATKVFPGWKATPLGVMS